MKLLGWMHRKFRQNSSEPFKDLVIGNINSCEEEHNHTKGYKHVKQTRKCLGVEEDEYEGEGEGEGMYEVFHGFLAIGTLGSPAFVENITEKEEEVTENELKLINDELEKVLVDDIDESCGSGKADTAVCVCPLQGYLFGSAIELSETTTTVAKKEHRASLGELFQRTKFAEETNFGAIRKKLKNKKMLHHTSSHSATPDTKLHKILHMFHRKIHPENSTAAQKCDKYQKNENKKKTINGNPEEDIIMIHPKRALPKENTRQYKIQSNPLQVILGCSEDSSENKEHWIKTDADYLVLEL
ncbi:hypothetical protein Fmac_022861 [Flemingia macrophylla]|uniref:LAZY1 n=1 Tax=Flemingia macrophylla TaxID=520843 RepID=A0ABD1LJU5_9FABA